MKRLRIFILLATILAIAATSLWACSPSSSNTSSDKAMYSPSPTGSYSETGDVYNKITENPFVNPKETPNSTFSLAVNTAGYANLRRYIREKKTISADMVKIEEVVNYFKYDYPDPAEGDPVSLTPKLFACPWNSAAKLLTVGVKAEELEIDNIANNLVFLLDVSGSMCSPDKIGFLQSSMLMLLENLDQNDRVSIVTYAGAEAVLLEGANGSQKDEISSVINNLTAGGTTAGGAGIQKAYELAAQYFISSGNNRVILATDGDFNVGISSQSDLENLIAEKRATGVYLTCLGFGTGNLHATTMETLANKGNGNYSYIDSLTEARKVLVENIGGTLHIAARDAKVKVEFNPAKVASYRLLGYENSLISLEEYLDDATDAGEIGSGFTVTAVYEVLLADDPETPSTMEQNFLNVELRYKSPDTADETQLAINAYASAADILETPGEDQMFISALVETCLVLRKTQYKGTSNLDNVLARLNTLQSVESDTYRSEFKTLVQTLISDYDYITAQQE